MKGTPRGGRFRTIHTPLVQTGETREMQEKRTPAGEYLGGKVKWEKM